MAPSLVGYPPPYHTEGEDWAACLAVDAQAGANWSLSVSLRIREEQGDHRNHGGRLGRWPRKNVRNSRGLAGDSLSPTNRKSPGQKQGLARAETGNVCGECPPKTPKTPPPGLRTRSAFSNDRTGRSRFAQGIPPPDVGIEGAFWLVPIVLSREPIEHQKRHRETVALTECLCGELHAGPDRATSPLRPPLPGRSFCGPQARAEAAVFGRLRRHAAMESRREIRRTGSGPAAETRRQASRDAARQSGAAVRAPFTSLICVPEFTPNTGGVMYKITHGPIQITCDSPDEFERVMDYIRRDLGDQLRVERAPGLIDAFVNPDPGASVGRSASSSSAQRKSSSSMRNIRAQLIGDCRHI